MNSQYKNNAFRKNIVRGCISKEEQTHMDKFQALGVKVLYTYEVNEAYVVEIPIDKVEEFVELYLDIIQPGYWNEYVGSKTGFFAKIPSGETWHFELTEQNSSKINKRMKEMVAGWEIDTDLWKWLAEVEIYRGWIKQ